jgi:hypothetical protein
MLLDSVLVKLRGNVRLALATAKHVLIELVVHRIAGGCSK